MAVTSHRCAWQAFIAAGIVSIAPALWGLAELAPDSVSADAQPDYLVHPLALSTAARVALTVGAGVLVITAVFVFTRAVRRHEIDRRWAGVIIPLSAVTAATGLIYSAITAPVIGANIGGGLAIMAGVPFAVAMLVLAAVRSLRLWRHRPE